MNFSDDLLLLDLLRNPEKVLTLSLHQWDFIIPQARSNKVLGFLACQAMAQGWIDQVPEPVRPHLVAENRLVLRQERMVRWEVDRIAYALHNVDTPIVLLKGAAYRVLDLPFAKGRLYGDIDVLIHRSALGDAEAALKKNGWREKEGIDQLNSSYFRQWLHELPPLQHRERRTEIDVHHTILPLTDRLNVNPVKLIAASRPVEKKYISNRIRALSPADMVLHAATHLFRGSDYSTGLRDLFDLHGLVTYFSSIDPNFWSILKTRALVLDLKRPCFYAMRYTQNYFHTEIPLNFIKTIENWAPSKLSIKIFDWLVAQAIISRRVDSLDPVSEMALFFLSYWPLPKLQTWLKPLFWMKRFQER